MNKKDVAIYLDRYNSRLSKFGYSPESLGWGGGKERQFLRFKTLTEIGVGKGDSIIDVGCGFGDLFEYLGSTDWKGDYLGLDINSKLLDVAKKTHQGINVKELNILNSKELLSCDWVICSGVFNAQLDFESNFDYIKKMLRKMFLISRKGVAVDFMSTYVDFQAPGAYHTSPTEIIDFCKKELKANLVIRMDYLPFEFSAYIKK